MKKFLLFTLTASLGLFAMAQQPTVKAQGQVKGDTKVTFTSSSAPNKQDNKDRIHISENVLKYGQENVIKFSVDKIQDKQLIVKVVSEDLCAFRKGEKFGEYVFTPKVQRGTVKVRVGYMDVLGAYQNLGNVELYIGVRERAEGDNARSEGQAERANTEAQRQTDNPSDNNRTVTTRRTEVITEQTVVE